MNEISSIIQSDLRNKNFDSPSKRRKLDFPAAISLQNHANQFREIDLTPPSSDFNASEFSQNFSNAEYANINGNSGISPIIRIIDEPQTLQQAFDNNEVYALNLDQSQVKKIQENFDIQGFVEDSDKHFYATMMQRGFKICECSSCQKLQRPILIK